MNGFIGVSVTAPGRAPQYNTITEKYVNNAVRENEKSNIVVMNPIEEEKIHLQHQHNIEHLVVPNGRHGNNYVERGKHITEEKFSKKDEYNEKRIVSHNERFHEHYKVIEYHET